MQPGVLDEAVGRDTRYIDQPGDPSRLTRSEVVAVAGTVLAFVATVIVVLSTQWAATGDVAMMEMLARDVPSHVPLVGVY